jgi:hypothetical protein
VFLPHVIQALQVRPHESVEHRHTQHGAILKTIVVAGKADVNVLSSLLKHDLRCALHEIHDLTQDGMGHGGIVMQKVKPMLHADQFRRRLKEPTPGTL